MTGPRIDLHSHSNASDGTEPPAGVARRAKAAGLDVFALTDHDTVSGLAEAGAEAARLGITLIPGMELSCRRDGRAIHLLVYLFDPGHPELAAECARIRDARVGRARDIVDRLIGLDVPITWDRVAALAGGGVVGRAHIARAMVEVGVIDTVQDAFTPEWIGTGGRAHVTRYALDPAPAVRLARAAGGVPVLAHAWAPTRGGAMPAEWLAELAEAGLFGVEADHPQHDPAARAELRGLAKELGLAVTGSSDDHGEFTGHRLGCETTSPETLERLIAEARGASGPTTPERLS
ncbi:PHP domain-containing protein [Rhizohabitans arisaemae]|uniref:PHP domain-containing protein n=1 Tax=Rhizohabitans arisaemae TaxID=2720610 RepID=UPI0024B1A521|nr:PHP domain-containing protein [Rhizohabitans arisaemae]